MKLPRFTAKTPPPRESGLARATDIGALTRTGDIEVWRGVSQLGGAMQGAADLGYRAWQERHDIDTGIQHAKSTSALNMAYTDIQGELDNTPVETDAIRTKLRTEKLKELEDLYNQTRKGLDNKNAANQLRKSWELMKSQFDAGIYQTLSRNLNEQQKLDKMTIWQAMLVNAAAEDLASVKQNIREDVEKHLPLFGASGVQRIIGNLDKLTTDIREDYYKDLIYNGTSDLDVLTEQIQQDDSVDKKKLLNNIDEVRQQREKRDKEAIKELVDKTTSNTIREYFNGELLVSTLNERHAKGLIRDSEFKFMMKGLAQIAPDHSDSFAAGNIRRAKTDFDIGAIDRAEADKITLENYAKLDNTDRSKVVADLEDIEAKIIATAKSNAYSEGRGLMSQRFAGIQSEEDLIDLFRGAGLTEAEKKRINRRWTAEVNNKDLYERAVDDRFKEMRQKKISDVDKYKAESLRVLLQYQKRKRLSIEGLERAVAEEQRIIISTPTQVKPVGEMTTEEKQRELIRIRELRQLAR